MGEASTDPDWSDRPQASKSGSNSSSVLEGRRQPSGEVFRCAQDGSGSPSSLNSLFQYNGTPRPWGGVRGLLGHGK